MKKIYLKEFKADYNYFKDSCNRADFQIDIENANLKDIPNWIIDKMQKK